MVIVVAVVVWFDFVSFGFCFCFWLSVWLIIGYLFLLLVISLADYVWFLFVFL